MNFKTVTYDHVSKFRNVFNKTHYIQFQNYYPIKPKEIELNVFKYEPIPAMTVRSATIQVYTTGREDDEEMFGSGITISFKIDVIRKFEIIVEDPWKELCLGSIDIKTNKWFCYSRDTPFDSSINMLEIQKMEYIIYHPGTYAVILRPLYNPYQKKMAFKGMIALHKK